MVVVFEIEGRKAIDHLNDIVEKLPKEIKLATEEFGRSLQNRMKLQITAKQLTWRGKLHDQTNWRNTRDGGYLFMPIHGVYLDKMRPHWVKLKRGRLIRQWAFEKGHYFVKAAATAQRSIFVKPHPFIRGPIDRTIAALPAILQRAMAKAVRK